MLTTQTNRFGEPLSAFVQSLRTVRQDIAACFTTRRYCIGPLAKLVDLPGLDLISLATDAGASHFTFADGVPFSHVEWDRRDRAQAELMQVWFSAQPAKLLAVLTEEMPESIVEEVRKGMEGK